MAIEVTELFFFKVKRVLLKIERAGFDGVGGGACPSCGGCQYPNSSVHEVDCELDSLLKDIQEKELSL